MTITSTNLIQLQKRIEELEQLADEIVLLAGKLKAGEGAQPDLAIKGQKWYRGAREFLVQQKSSGIEEFEYCYQSYHKRGSQNRTMRNFTDIEHFINLDSCDQEHYDLFYKSLRKAISIVQSTVEEVLSRELPVITQLSFELSASEFETAQELLDQSNNIDPVIRASGVIARVALERHLLTTIDKLGLSIQKNPPNKKKPDLSDLSITLKNEGIINAVQKSELDSLLTIANHCAHPRENATFEDVRRLIERGQALASVIL